ncbi:MAG: response regulator [Vicinamibacteria bacterium]
MLVVDDNEENRDVLSRRLLRRGFNVLSAEGGRQALRLLDSHPIDLVLLDIMMPDVSGIDVLREVRKSRSPEDLPIIMATAKSDSDDVVEALELGANDYVTKPLDFPVVLARLQSQLRGRASRAAKDAREEALAARRLLDGPEVRPGGVLADRYRLESRIGAGAFGTVYRAIHLELDAPVAVKVLQAGMDTAPDALARFRREGISACRVRHPNAVSVLDFGITPSGVAYLVMELLDGHSLLEELLRKRTLPPGRCARLLIPVCDVLATAHDTGVIHRDVKPSNIFLQRTPVGEIVKVLDFGIAKIAGEAALGQSLTVEGSILGTPAYMAPERFGGRGYDGRSDVYALGISLYQMLEGRLPFMSSAEPMAVAMMHINEPPPPLTRLASPAREEMQRLLDWTLAKKPPERPSARELGAALAQVVDRLGDDPRLALAPSQDASQGAFGGPLEVETLDSRAGTQASAERSLVRGFTTLQDTLDPRIETLRSGDALGSATLRPGEADQDEDQKAG